MFKDRRNTTERRSQSLSMPEPLDRRISGRNNRRLRNFQSKPWWLSIDYCEELVGKSNAQETHGIEQVSSVDPLQKS